jgi:hypothetical protein
LQRDGIDFSNLYVGLVHYPVCDPEERVISSAVTNLDIHDTARCASTFGIPVAYIINPLDSQRELVHRIIDHWTKGAGANRNPCRKEALERVRVKAKLLDVTREISDCHGLPVMTVATDARWQDGMISYAMMREFLCNHQQPFLLLFGTAWGLAQEVFDQSDHVLAPIEGVIEYNHLSVRAAMAIVLDRLTRNRYRGGS